MAGSIPEPFVDLATASSRVNAEVNVMGRVTDFMPPSKTRGTDWMCTFSIADRSFGAEYGDGLKIRFFRPVQDELPSFQISGDVILLRNLKIKEYQGMTMGLSTHTTSWTIFQASSIPKKTPANTLNIKSTKSRQAPQPKHSEVLYSIELCNLRDRESDKRYDFLSPAQSTPIPSLEPSSTSDSSTKISSPPTSSRTSFGGRDKFSLIKDLQIDTFYDLVGQVVKIYPNMGRLEMYITDYTSNNMLYRYEWDKPDKENTQYGDEYGYSSKNIKSHKWQGPYGQMTIMVTMWPPHSHFAQSRVKEWDFVLLQNVRAKLDKDSKMEAMLSEDKRHPSKINVRVIKADSDDRVKDVLRRKREYNEKFKTQSASFINQVRNQIGDGKPLSKGQRRKKAKLEREKAKLQGLESEAKKRRLENHEYHYHDEPVALALPKASNDALNKNIHCSHHTIPTRPLSAILSLEAHQNTSPSGVTYTLPFQNTKSRATVRIVDFFPPKLEKFAVLLPKPSEFDALSDYEPSDRNSAGQASPGSSMDIDGDEDERKWEWRFGLVLEDASDEQIPKGEGRAQVIVYVAEQDAEFLLKLDAEDLSKNDQALSTLREKLFLLWGDLEERKIAERNMEELTPPNAQVSPAPAAEKTLRKDPQRSQPFQCCLQEYGIRSYRKGRRRRGSEGEQSDGDASSEDEEDTWEWERRWRMFGTTII